MSHYSRRPRIGRIVRRGWYPLLALLCLILSQVATIGPGASPAVAHAAVPPLIDSVLITGPSSNPTVTINGAGFGPAPQPSGAQPTSNSTYCASCTGSNYGSQLYIADNNARNPGGSWTAGADANFVGLLNLQYADTQVQYSFGSYYG